MKKWGLHIALFSLCFLVLDTGYFWVLKQIPVKQPDRRLEKLITGKINADILILGSSRAAHNLLAEELEKQVHQSAFNLGFRGTNVSFHLQVLQWYLQKNKTPKILVYVADVPFLFDQEALKYRTDLLLPFVCYSEYNKELIRQGALSKLAYGLNFAKSTYQTAFTTPRKTIENHTDTRGSNPLPVEKYRGNGDHFVAHRKIVEDSKKIEDFQQLQKLCKKNGIQLVVAIPPNNEPLDVAFVSTLKEQCWPSTACYTYQRKYTTPNHRYFYDVSHLNQLGANLFTQEISTFLLLNP